ncbi:MAG: hypothetical protein EOP25_06980 [Rhodococcus sp. (in: high G+C Gram-positive bacteria)]|nr:MAG: hypothetical protein EOP25_06980 [Rhodococcus sp. (in: high G+C Gram-positive bacteria)]
MKIVVAESNLIPHRSRLEAAVPSESRLSWHGSFDEAALIEDLRDADVYVGGRFTPSMASAAERLRLVHVAGAGTDNINFDALAQDVLVANTFHHEKSIAEYVVAAAVMLRRGFVAQDKALRQGVWATSVYDDLLTQSNSLQGARVGFVGFGHIGQATWTLFRAFGASGAAVTGRGNVDAPSAGLDWAADVSQLGRLLVESDVVVVSAPLDDRTRGMIGAAELRALGSGGVLVNVGRGPLVQEQALFDALSSSTIAAAAIDVWYDYPGPDGRGRPSALPFAELPNILMTPHSSGVSRQTFLGRVDDIADNITRLARGEHLRNVVAPQSGVPGLDSVYGVHQGAAGYEPASRGALPVEEVWDTDAYLNHAPRILEAVREHVGPELKLLHDAHHRLTPQQAARLGKSVEHVDLFWLEDVTPAENQDALRLVRNHTTTPLAIGEVFNTIWDCQHLITEQLIDFIRVAIVHAGGISHVRKIFALAEVYQIRGGPHGPSDVSPISLGASLHLGLATPNFGIQEYMGYDPLVSEVFPHAWSFADGHLTPGDVPGIGVSMNEELAEQYPYEQAYLPVARRRDGSMTDW